MDFRFKTNLRYLLNRSWGCNKIDNPLVDTELEVVVRLGTVTARSAAGCDPQPAARHRNRAADFDVLTLELPYEAVADLLQVGELRGRNGEADALVGFGGHCLLLLVASGNAHLKRKAKRTLSM